MHGQRSSSSDNNTYVWTNFKMEASVRTAVKSLNIQSPATVISSQDTPVATTTTRHRLAPVLDARRANSDDLARGTIVTRSPTFTAYEQQPSTNHHHPQHPSYNILENIIPTPKSHPPNSHASPPKQKCRLVITASC